MTSSTSAPTGANTVHGSNGHANSAKERPAEAAAPRQKKAKSQKDATGQSLWSNVRQNLRIYSGGLHGNVTAHIRTAVVQVGSDRHMLCVEVLVCGNKKNREQVTRRYSMGYAGTADALGIFRFHQLLATLPFIDLDGPHLQELFMIVCGDEASLSGKRLHRIRKLFGTQIKAALAAIPQPADMLHALTMAHEFNVSLATESLTKLAADGTFTLTAELLQSGVESVEVYRQRQVEVDNLYNSLACTLSMVCRRYGIDPSMYKSVLEGLVKADVKDRNLCLALLISRALVEGPGRQLRQSIESAKPGEGVAIPLSAFFGFAGPNPIASAINIVANEQGWGRTDISRFTREFDGLIVQLRRLSQGNEERSSDSPCAFCGECHD